MSTTKTKPGPPGRIISMDQFRGYTVAGMFLVNFLGSYAAIHPVLKHNNNYFSYADSIMPSFLFAVGFSFRLTYLRRRAQSSVAQTNWTYIRRSLALIVVSLVMYGFGGRFGSWNSYEQMPPEFESLRASPPPTKSFETLLKSAQQKHPAADSRTLDGEALGIGMAGLRQARGRNGGGSPDVEAGQAALRQILEEGKNYVDGFVQRDRDWASLGSTGHFLIHLRIGIAKLLKSDLWETLAIIGVTQIVVLPFIGLSFSLRLLALIGFGVLHCLLSYWFNWDFVYAINDNWMTKLFGTGHSTSWDGGFFGPIGWGVAMLAGTLAYDMVAAARAPGGAAGELIGWGVTLMTIGYAMSCLTRLYELSPAEIVAIKDRAARQGAEIQWINMVMQHQGSEARNAKDPAVAERLRASMAVLRKQQQLLPDLKHAESPVLPPWKRFAGKSLREILVEPPFMAPPKDGPDAPPPQIEHRQWNYWMMGKRMPSLSFIVFASGFAFALYGLFVIVCDRGGFQVGMFRTFGTNALIAYFLHHVIEEVVHPLVPHDSPLWYSLAGLGFFFLLTYVMVRYLEKRSIYLKL